MARIAIAAIFFFNGSLWAGGISTFPIHVGSGGQLYPVISGTSVFWTEYQPDSSLYLIRGKDLRTGNMVTIGAPGSISALSAGGGLLLWSDNPHDRNVFAYDLLSEQAFPVCTAPGRQFYPCANDDYIVWDDARGGESRIYAMDRKTGTEFRLSNFNTLQMQPAISDRYIVWDDDRYPFWQDGTFPAHDIMAYDLQTGQEIAVTNRAGMQAEPAVSGNIVVWMDSRDPSGEYHIYGKDLGTGIEFPVSTGPGWKAEPAVDGNYVVWVDSRPDAPGLYGYDLSTKQEFPIRLCPGPAYLSNICFPKISGNLVVWNECTSLGDPDIYGAYIPEPGSLGLLMSGALLGLRRRR